MDINMQELEDIGKDGNVAEIQRSEKVAMAFEGEEEEEGGEEGGGEGGPQLKKNITVIRGVCLVVGTIIGSGIFVSPNNITISVKSPAMSIMIWLGGGILAAVGGLTFAELGTMITESGAEVTFLKRAYGPLHRFGSMPSFLAVWLLHFLLSGARRAIAVLTFSKYFWSLFKDDSDDINWGYDKLLCTVVLVVMILIIATKPTLTLKFIVLWTVLKTSAIVFIIIIGMVTLCQGKVHNIAVGFSGTDWNPQLWGAAWNNVIWSYLGWEQICIVTGEVVNPQRNVPIIIGASVSIVTVLYMLTVLSYHVVLPLHVMMGEEAIATVFGFETLGDAGKIILACSVAVSTLGSFQCTLLTQSRYIHTAGVQGSLPRVFGLISERFSSPLIAVLYLGCITFGFMMVGNLGELIDTASFTVFPFYVLCAIGLFVMRKTQPNLPRPYRVPLIFPAIFILIGLYVFITPFINNLFYSLLWIGILVLGIPVYFIFIQDIFGLKFTFMDRVTKVVGDFTGCK